MKNLSTILFSSLLAVSMVFAPCQEANAWNPFKPKKKQEPKEAVQPVRDENLDDMSFIEMINSVPLDEKSAALIRKISGKGGTQQAPHTRL